MLTMCPALGCSAMSSASESGTDIGRGKALELAHCRPCPFRLPVMTRHASVLNRMSDLRRDPVMALTILVAKLNGIAGVGKGGAHVKEGVAKRASQNKIQPARTRGLLASRHPGILGSRVWGCCRYGRRASYE